MRQTDNDAIPMDLYEELVALLEGRNGFKHKESPVSSQRRDEDYQDDIENICKMWEEKESNP